MRGHRHGGGDPSLERGLVELRITKGREGYAPALHRRDEALLANYDIRDVGVFGAPGEIQTRLRLAPHRVEWIVPREKEYDMFEHRVAGEDRITCLNCCPNT